MIRHSVHTLVILLSVSGFPSLGKPAEGSHGEQTRCESAPCEDGNWLILLNRPDTLTAAALVVVLHGGKARIEVQATTVPRLALVEQRRPVVALRALTVERSINTVAGRGRFRRHFRPRAGEEGGRRRPRRGFRGRPPWPPVSRTNGRQSAFPTAMFSDSTLWT